MTAMFSKVWIINMVLAILIVFCWIRIWDGPDMDINVPLKSDTVQDGSALPSKLSVAGAWPASSAEYENIVEMNLFSSERTFVPKVVEAESEEIVVEEEVRISGEKVLLYGVVLLDNIKKALINNPARKPGDRDFLWITEGEKLNNLKVTRIDPEQLLLNDGTAQYRIGLYDPGKDQRKGPPPGRTSASQKRDAPQVISADPAPAAGLTTRAGAGSGAPAPASRQPAEAKKQAVTGNDDDEYEIIDTPFGEIRRKKTR